MAANEAAHAILADMGFDSSIQHTNWDWSKTPSGIDNLIIGNSSQVDDFISDAASFSSKSDVLRVIHNSLTKLTNQNLNSDKPVNYSLKGQGAAYTYTENFLLAQLSNLAPSFKTDFETFASRAKKIRIELGELEDQEQRKELINDFQEAGIALRRKIVQELDTNGRISEIQNAYLEQGKLLVNVIRNSLG